MKIGIDISTSEGEKTGVGYYIDNLVHSLAKIDNKNDYILYPSFCGMTMRDMQHITNLKQENFHLGEQCLYRYLPKKAISALWHLPIPKSLILGFPDIIHSTSFGIPKHCDSKIVTTIYDISCFTVPDFHTQRTRDHSLNGIRDAVKYADRIIAISNHGKAELVKHFGINPDKIDVTHLAAKDIFKPCSSEEQDRVCTKYGIPRDFIFSIGSLEPRKNIRGLVGAYANLPENLREKHPLIIAGGKGWLNSDINSLIDSFPCNQVRRIGYVDEKDLPGLYSSATLFAYPSFYEGFGLPILEAMACGTPVISSITSSMPEVAGDAAILIDPYNIKRLTDLMIRVIENDDLRIEMHYQGLEQAMRFSWEKTAKETLKIYEGLM